MHLRHACALILRRWVWDGKGKKSEALKAAWEASAERRKVVESMSASERSKRRLTL